jgi:hypothetical protein
MDVQLPINACDRILPWGDEVETLMRNWCGDCSKRSVMHSTCAHTKKKYFCFLSIPTIIIPIAMGSFSQMFPDCANENTRLVSSIGYVLSGSLAGVGTFLNYGNQYAQHAQYEILYHELHTEIQSILSKPASFRGHADVVLLHMRLKYDALNKGSPDL